MSTTDKIGLILLLFSGAAAIFLAGFGLSNKKQSPDQPNSTTDVKMSDVIKNKLAADVVAGKIAGIFEIYPWCTGVAIREDEKYGYVVELCFDPEALRLKPEHLQHFLFNREEDGVQVRLVPVAHAVAGEEAPKPPIIDI